MAWQMPAAVQWNAAAAMAIPQDMNMGAYTPEQWAALQQQNWQQWTQWQQQYSQWQTQYGEKYAQMQAAQAMSGMPPLPVGTVAPPAPPPPDQPPPPPPNENNQPLYGSNTGQPTPVPSLPLQQRNTSNYSIAKPATGNNQWSYSTDAVAQAQLPAANTDALNKLAEEEKLFDIQFQKWEEEIEKWRKENVNHPDKQAYREYEQKFEACRAQLLERRQQMKLKRARLLGNNTQATNVTSSGNAAPTAVPPVIQKTTANDYSQVVQSQNYKNSSYQQDYNTPQQSYNRSNNKNIDPQDRFESYQNMESPQDSYSTAKSDPSTFLPTTSTAKGIPGLDLVPDTSQSKKSQDIIDITEDQTNVLLQLQQQPPQAPDYSKISKGINNILGDEKIMNILSMVQGHNIPQNVNARNLPPNVPYAANNQNYPLNQTSRNQNNLGQDQQFGNRQNMPPSNRQGPNYPMSRNQGMNSQYSNQQGMYDEEHDIRSDQYYDGNVSFAGLNMQQGGPSMRPGGPDMRPVGPDMRQGGPDMRQGGLGLRQGGYDMRLAGNIRSGGPDMRQGGPDMRQGGSDMRQDGPDLRQGGPDMRSSGPGMRPGGPNMRQAGPDMRQGGPDMRQGGSDMRQGGLDIRQGGPDMRPGGLDLRQGGPDIRTGGPDLRQGGLDMRQGGSDMRQGGLDMRQGGSDMRQGGPDLRQGGSDMRQGGPDMRQGGPDMRQGGPDMRQGGSDMRPGGPEIRQGGPDIRLGGTGLGRGGPHMPQGGPNLNQGGPNMRQALLQDMRRDAPGSIPPLLVVNNRPPLQDMSGQQNVDDYYGGSERVMHDKNPVVNQPSRPKWVDEPLFAPSIVVEYDHKPLRLKARDFIEPVHTFDYNHKSKDEELNKKKDFEKEVEELFVRKPRRDENDDRYTRDPYHRDYERRVPREEIREDRDLFREDYRDIRDDFRDRLRDRPLLAASRDDFERRRIDDRFDERRRDERRDERRDDRDRFHRRDDFRDRESGRDAYRDRNRDIRRDDSRDMRREDMYRDMRREDMRKDDIRRDDMRREDVRRDDMRREERNRSASKDRDSRKRALSKDSEVSTISKKSKDNKDNNEKKHIVMIDDILEPPGRTMRPEKLIIILRGPPGSGKSYLAKLIRDREAEHGGTARIMSIDDYFMQEGETEEKDPATGKTVKKPYLKYEYDAASEETYVNSLKRAFKRSLTDGYFSFLIYDAVNDQLKSYADIWNFARQSGFQAYICTMELDAQTCFKRNIHNRKLDDIEVICSRFFPTPDHHIQLDATTLLQSASITEVQMEDVEDDVIMEDVQPEVESVFTSKWEKMDDASQLARLDGTNKPLRPSQLSMEDYLQLDEWKPNVAKPGKKTVRWADIEERREQEKMRAIGFVVGQTDWNRMTDPTMGSSALTKTKYIERVRRT